MNIKAAFKTLLVVLSVGALMGFNQWKIIYGGTPEERAKRAIAGCIKASDEAIYQAHSGVLSRAGMDEQQRGRATCRQNQLAHSDGPQYAPPTGNDQASTVAKGMRASATNGARKVPSTPSKKEHFMASGQRMTQSREQCLMQLEEARKRSPGGLNPEWEQGQRDRCQVLYSDAEQ